MGDKVLALLVASPMGNLEDFRFYFTDEREVDAFVGQVSTRRDQPLRIQVSRLGRAWASVGLTDFRLYSTDEKEVDAFVGQVSTLKDQLPHSRCQE